MSLKELFWIIFPPLEVKATIAEIESFFRAYGFSMGAGFVEGYIKAGVKEHVEETVYSIRIEHKKPEYLALLSITKVIGMLLISGNYHVYRGTLDPIGEDMFKMWKRAVKLLKKRGYCTDKEAKKDKEWIKEQIADMG